MKRVLSLVLALVLVLGMIPTFAAEKTGGEELKALGLLSGNENGDLMEDQTLERQEFAKIIAQLNGALDEAAAYVTPGTFADFDKVEGWAKPYVAYAEEQGWMTGKNGNMFDPEAELKSQELLTVLLRVLGYDDTWSKVFETAAEVGLVAEEITAITRGDAFELIWTAVSEVKMADSDMTLGVHLGVLEPAKPVVTDLTVESVSATNLREVIVEFNNEIDADTLDKANFTIGGTAATSVALSEDGMTVTAWFELANQSTYTLKIASVKDVNGSEVKAFSQQFTINDFSAPVVEKVTVVGNKKLVVTFSEPVTPATAQILSNYKIDDLLFGASVSVDGRNVTLILSNRLAEGVHKLSVNSNVVDFANFKLVANNTEFAVAKDDTKAALASVDSATQTKVVITLSKPVEDTFTVTPTSGTFVSKTTKDNQTWTFTFLKASPLPLSGTELKLTGVTDYYGNKGDLTFKVVPTLDLTRPEVVSVTPKSQTTLEVVFSKAVEIPATSAFTIKTVATTPVAASVSGVAYAKDAKNENITTTLIVTGVFAAKDYTVEIAGVVDTTVQANVMVPYAGTLTVADLTAPTVSSVKVVQPTTSTAGKIIIEFSEKVNATTALDKANYSYILDTTKPVSLGTAHTITLLSNGKGVEITVPKNAATPADVADDQLSSVTVMNVTDEAGNKVAATIVSSGSFATVPNTALVLSGQAAVAKNKVVITVPANINPATVTASDFRIEGSSSTTDYIYVINAEYSSDDNEITLTLASDLSVTAQVNGKAATLMVVAGNLADIYGNKVTLTSGVATVGVVADKIAPVAVKVASAVATSATVTTIKVNLSEALAGTLLDEAYMVVKLNGVLYTADKFVVSYGVDGTTPQLTFVVTTTASMATKSYSVELFKHAGTADAATNQLATFTFTGTVE